MRLISQDGKGDMPYEGFVFGCHGGTIVATRDIFGSPKSVIAQYSSEEKAIKVMEMVRNSYAKFILFQTTYQNGVLEKLTKELGENEALNIVTPIFRFPKDEEVEV